MGGGGRGLMCPLASRLLGLMTALPRAGKHIPGKTPGGGGRGGQINWFAARAPHWTYLSMALVMASRAAPDATSDATSDLSMKSVMGSRAILVGIASGCCFGCCPNNNRTPVHALRSVRGPL